MICFVCGATIEFGAFYYEFDRLFFCNVSCVVTKLQHDGDLIYTFNIEIEKDKTK